MSKAEKAKEGPGGKDTGKKLAKRPKTGPGFPDGDVELDVTVVEVCACAYVIGDTVTPLPLRALACVYVQRNPLFLRAQSSAVLMATGGYAADLPDGVPSPDAWHVIRQSYLDMSKQIDTLMKERTVSRQVVPAIEMTGLGGRRPVTRPRKLFGQIQPDAPKDADAK